MQKTKLALFLILLLGAILRFYQLDNLPGEIYGDIVIIFKYVESILAFHWPFYFSLSAGPLYHYLIAPLFLILGKSYLTIKIASSLVGIITIYAIYLLAREVGSQKEALLASFIAAVSSWLLVFSRLGNSQIIIPLEVAVTLIFVFKAIRQKSAEYWWLATAVSAAGLYTYPQTFVLPVLVVILGLFEWLKQVHHPKEMTKTLMISLALLIITVVPFIRIIRADPHNFLQSGYIASHLWQKNQSYLDTLTVLLSNLKKSLLMLHVQGDAVFRSNPSGLPHLDFLSGVFFLVGLFSFLQSKRRHLFYLIIAYLILLLPSIMVLNQPQEVPSASRSMGVIPIVYLLVGSGISWFYEQVKQGVNLRLAQAMLVVILLVITYPNYQRYFVTYAQNLPNHNTPFAKIIAQEIDKLPSGTQVYIVGCCWGESGQPEPAGIIYALKKDRALKFFAAHSNPYEFSCQGITSNLFLVVNPSWEVQKEKIRDCFYLEKERTIWRNGWPVATIYEVQY